MIECVSQVDTGNDCIGPYIDTAKAKYIVNGQLKRKQNKPNALFRGLDHIISTEG